MRLKQLHHILPLNIVQSNSFCQPNYIALNIWNCLFKVSEITDTFQPDFSLHTIHCCRCNFLPWLANVFDASDCLALGKLLVTSEQLLAKVIACYCHGFFFSKLFFHKQRICEKHYIGTTQEWGPGVYCMITEIINHVFHTKIILNGLMKQSFIYMTNSRNCIHWIYNEKYNFCKKTV